MLDKNAERGTQWRATIRSAMNPMTLLWPPPKAFARRKTKLAQLPKALKKVDGKRHINFGKLDPRPSESDGRGFLLAGVDMVFVMFFFRTHPRRKECHGRFAGGHLACIRLACPSSVTTPVFVRRGEMV